MRIGITTIHHVTNYGAVWQAYALSRHVASLGHEVEIIDFRPQVAVDFYRQRFIQNGRPNFKRAILSLVFQNFIRRSLPLSPILCTSARNLADTAKRYDALIAGSDQIWCTGEGSFRGYEPNFFLDFCQDPKVRKISYAASAGNTKDFAEHTPAIARSLAAFSAISVRDESTATLVKAASGISPTLVLDPTFLHDFSEIVGDVTPGNDLVIFAENPERFAGFATAIARKHNLRIVAVGKPSRVANVNQHIVSPIAWLRCIKGAKVVLTDFFHGTALSLQFGRPLLVSAPAIKTKKITDLLRRVGLSDLYLDETKTAAVAVEEALGAPDRFSAMIKERLSPHQMASRLFLKNALSKP
jgi:hypothetical protein